MKILTLAAAGLVAVAGLAPGVAAPASAQRSVVTERTVIRHGGPRYRHRARTVCTWKWRNHRRVRICRTVRR